MPGVRVTRVVNEDTNERKAVCDAFAAAVNAALASPVNCPEVPGTDEQTELRRIWEMTVKAAPGSVPGAAS